MPCLCRAKRKLLPGRSNPLGGSDVAIVLTCDCGPQIARSRTVRREGRPVSRLWPHAANPCPRSPVFPRCATRRRCRPCPPIGPSSRRNPRHPAPSREGAAASEEPVNNHGGDHSSPPTRTSSSPCRRRSARSASAAYTTLRQSVRIRRPSASDWSASRSCGGGRRWPSACLSTTSFGRSGPSSGDGLAGRPGRD